MAAVITASVINAFSSDRASNTQADAAKQASQTQADANRYAADIQYKMFQEQQALEKPWLDVGKNALARLSTGLERGGEFGTPFTQTNWQQDPGYAFRLEEGQRALDRSAAARGGLISGNALKAAQRYGQAMGSQEYQNAFDRYYREREAMLNPLQSLARVGQTTAQSLGGAAQQYGSAAGALASATGAAGANALLAQGNARASAYGGLRKRKIHYSARRLSDYTIKLTPSLVLHGVWFQQAGFCIGDVVDVEVGNGKIVISNPLPF